MTKDLISVSDLSSEDIRLLISSAVDMKAEGQLALLGGKILALVFEQAENRLHLQKALLAQMLGGLEIPLTGYR